MITNNFFQDFDFQILNSNDFKEDAVREELINPILKKLGYKAYGKNRIIYSKTLSHPFVKIGSGKRKINIIPDYLFSVNDKYTWVLDAKAPNEKIINSDNVGQVYSYAIHPEVRADIFALCNGHEFVIYSKEEKEPLLFFQLNKIDKHWNEIQKLLSPDIFTEKQIKKKEKKEEKKNNNFNYLDCKLPKPIKKVRKQKAKRHYGVHGYFTRQSWDILQHYIKNFTKKGDLILDSFAGTGVTAIEALMLERKAINIDLNPMVIFLTKALTIPVDFEILQKEFEKIKIAFEKDCPETNEEIEISLKKYPFPQKKIFSKGADVENVKDLFSKKQLGQLAFLKFLIFKIKNKNIRYVLFLAFSSMLTKINLTYHSSKSRGINAGSAAAFMYYRYRIAKKTIELNVWYSFNGKYKKVVQAKKEILPFINKKTIKNLQIYKGSATNLEKIKNESIDYIYTDPPYGSKIHYLDLSVMWNAWLDLEVSEEDRNLEAIEGGSKNKSKDEYAELLQISIKEMYRVLKFNRWMSFVFAHKDPHYWHIIVDTAQKCGFEYIGVVKQSNGQTSFKKRQNPFSVLSGQLIINFIKKERPLSINKIKLGEIYDLVINTIENIIATNDGATIEEINDELIIMGLEHGFLHILSKEYKDLTPILVSEFDHNQKTEKFYIRKNSKFKSKIPLDMRIKYFLFSYFKQKEREDIYPTTDNIILDIMPLLQNGITPDDQTILIILRSLANPMKDNKWKLKEKDQIKIF